MRIGIFGGTNSQTIDDVVADARAVEQDGFATYYLPQVFGLDAKGVFAILAREVPRIELATFVVPTYSRHPLTMAQQALTVQAASGGRFTLGIGLSHQIVIESMFGLSFDRPLRHMREYLAALMPLLTEGKADVDGATISTHAAVDIEQPLQCSVIVAALGPKMLELAGTVADGTATWMTGAATLESHTVPTIAAAAERAGRASPRVASGLPICLTADVDAARERAATTFQIYGYLPSYRAMLDREGATGPADVAIMGDEATLTKVLGRLADAGATDFVAAIFGSSAERDATRAFLQSMV